MSIRIGTALKLHEMLVLKKINITTTHSTQEGIM